MAILGHDASHECILVKTEKRGVRLYTKRTCTSEVRELLKKVAVAENLPNLQSSAAQLYQPFNLFFFSFGLSIVKMV